MLFGLPPTPSYDAAALHAPRLEAALKAHGGDVNVVVSANYAALGDALMKREMALAWAPPIVCARVEMGGGRVLLRAVRGGVTAYRAGLVCRSDVDGAGPDLAGAASLVAAWVDEDSAAGFLLARSWLKARHIDALHGFKRALFVGSYVAAIQAVADGRADVASIYMSAEGAPPRSTLDEVDEALRARVRVFAHTGETQTDGVVTAPEVDEAACARVVQALLALANTDDGADLLTELIGCDELRDAPARPTSTALRDLIAYNDRQS